MTTLTSPNNSSSDSNVADSNWLADDWKYPWYALRTWHGMTFGVWCRLLREYDWAVSPARIPMALGITVASLLNSLAGWMDRWALDKKARRLRIKRQPVFLIGHWRTGTTLMHELFALDEQFAVPRTYQCMQPHHFVWTEKVLASIFHRMIPPQRPMDDMANGLDRPQEDEFALVNLGLHSPYLYWAFPSRARPADQLRSATEMTSADVAEFQRLLDHFVRRLTLADPRRLVLKSPPHTARIQPILELYPSARFVHLVREPLNVIPSTIRTWRRLCQSLTLERGLPNNLDDYVLSQFRRMYDHFESQRMTIPDGQIHEVRYEDLIRDPVGEMRAIYDHLRLGDFRDVQRKIDEYFQATGNRRKSKWHVPDALRQRIGEECREYRRKYGYEPSPSAHDNVTKHGEPHEGECSLDRKLHDLSNLPTGI